MGVLLCQVLKWIVELQEHVWDASAIVIAVEFTCNIAQSVKHREFGILCLLLIIVLLFLFHDVIQAFVKSLFEVVGVVESKWCVCIFLLFDLYLVIVLIIFP